MKQRILVVEDDAHLAELMKGTLEECGFIALTAGDGEKALETIRTAPDLILLDIMLPKVDGLTLLQRIRELNDWGSRVPIIIVSNLTPDTDRIIVATSKYGPTYYFVKADHSLAEIAGKVREVLSPQP